MYTDSNPHSLLEVVLVWFLYITGQVVPSMFNILFNPTVLLVLQEITFLLAIFVSIKNIFNITDGKKFWAMIHKITGNFKKKKHGSFKGHKKNM